jgi:hypothetical protein
MLNNKPYEFAIDNVQKQVPQAGTTITILCYTGFKSLASMSSES